MLKNKRGFSLIELTAVLFSISILLAFAIPQYRVSVMKTRIVNNMTLLRALQNDMINYYNMTGNLPTRINQLSINKDEYRNMTNTSATHIPTRCTITLEGVNGNQIDVERGIAMDCGAGWSMKYIVAPTTIGFEAGPRRFIISNSGSSYLNNIANELGWQHSGSNVYLIK